jgi:hypothetical protein
VYVFQLLVVGTQFVRAAEVSLVRVSRLLVVVGTQKQQCVGPHALAVAKLHVTVDVEEMRPNVYAVVAVLSLAATLAAEDSEGIAPLPGVVPFIAASAEATCQESSSCYSNKKSVGVRPALF